MNPWNRNGSAFLVFVPHRVFFGGGYKAIGLDPRCITSSPCITRVTRALSSHDVRMTRGWLTEARLGNTWAKDLVASPPWQHPGGSSERNNIFLLYRGRIRRKTRWGRRAGMLVLGSLRRPHRCPAVSSGLKEPQDPPTPRARSTRSMVVATPWAVIVHCLLSRVSSSNTACPGSLSPGGWMSCACTSLRLACSMTPALGSRGEPRNRKDHQSLRMRVTLVSRAAGRRVAAEVPWSPAVYRELCCLRSLTCVRSRLDDGLDWIVRAWSF